MWFVHILHVLLLISITVSTATQQDPPPPPPPPHRNLSILLIHSFYPSHCFPLFSLGAELASRGHRVSALGSVIEGYDFVTDLAESNGISYVEKIYVPKELFEGFREVGKHSGEWTNWITLFANLTSLFYSFKNDSDFFKIQERIKTLNGSDYDYIIAEQASIPLLYYAGTKWNTTNIMLLIILLDITPRHIIPWPYPRYLSPLPDDMSFIERLLNTVVYTPVEYALSYLITTFMAAFQLTLPDSLLSSILYQPVLYNTVIGLEWPKTSLPLQHYVGPMFLPNPSPLDPTLSKWMQTSPSPPIIFISMGTTAELTREMAEALLSLSEEYRLVWSLRESNHYVLDGLSVNSDTVYISPWVAQFTVLQHPSVVLAILHCGVNGVQEALYNEVPVLCIPYGMDQHDIALKLSHQKLGISLSPKDANKKNLREAVESLKGPFYQKKAKTISRLFKAGGGAKRGADLVELYAEVGYEHGLPSFIRYQWNSIQYYNIDVWVVLVALSLLFLWGCNKCCRYCCCCRRCCKKEKKTKRD